MTDENGTIRVGIVGAGWAGLQHARAYSAIDGVRIEAIAGLEQQARADIAQEFSIPHSVESWHELLDIETLDAISVAVPPGLHAPIAIAALGRGLHVLTEKPMASTVEDGRAMVAAAQRNNRVLDVVFNHRLRGDVSTLRRLANEGAFGHIYYARAWWLRSGGIPPRGSWFTRKEHSGGGPLIDLGVHVLDYALDALGEPRATSVSAVAFDELGRRGYGFGTAATDTNADAPFDVEDFASVLIRFGATSALQVETSWAAFRQTGDEMGITLYGSLGGAELTVLDNELEGRLRVFTPEGESTPEGGNAATITGGSGHQGVADAFIATIRAGSSVWPHHDGSIGLARSEIIEAAYASAASGRQVDL